MGSLKLESNNLFLRYGGGDNVLVLKLKAPHSPLVKEEDWEYVDTVGAGKQYRYGALEIFRHQIEGDDLTMLAAVLLKSRLLINREGYCYLESEIVGQPTATFSSVEYYRINDLFGWSEYSVKVEITTIWDRCNLMKGNIIPLETNNNLVNFGQIPKSEKVDKNSSDDDLKDYYEKRLMDTQVQLEEVRRQLQSTRVKLDASEKEVSMLRAQITNLNTNTVLQRQNTIAAKDSLLQGAVVESSQSNNQSSQDQPSQITPIDLDTTTVLKTETETNANDGLQGEVQTSNSQSTGLDKDRLSSTPDQSSQILIGPQPQKRQGHYTFETEESDKVIRSWRTVKPEHFMFQIESYLELKQSLQEANCEEFESSEFVVGKHTWVLSLYLGGNTNDNGEDHISLYLKLRRDEFNRCNSIKLLLRFFIYDQKQHRYLTIEDLDVRELDDHMNTEAGISQSLRITDFENHRNGFLRGGKCRFGVEILMLENSPHAAGLYLVKDLEHRIAICDFKEYSKMMDTSYSKSFKIENYTWKLQLYRNGKGSEENNSFSVFLELDDKSLIYNGSHIFVDFELRLKDKRTGGYHKKRGVAWFTQLEYNHGFIDFIALLQLHSSVSCFTAGDAVTIEVYFNSLYKLKKI